MPFRSEAQRRFMWANHPDIARRWSAEYGSKPLDRLVSKASGKKRRKRDRPR